MSAPPGQHRRVANALAATDLAQDADLLAEAASQITDAGYALREVWGLAYLRDLQPANRTTEALKVLREHGRLDLELAIGRIATLTALQRAADVLVAAYSRPRR